MGTQAVWTVRKRGDAAARQLADRHYNRRAVGAAMFAPPGKALVLVTPCERAAWVSSWTKFPDDGLWAYRCTLFRREGGPLASDLIRAAMAITVGEWAELDAKDGWLTYIDTGKVRAKADPGRCFLHAGWWVDETYTPDRRRRDLIRLRA